MASPARSDEAAAYRRLYKLAAWGRLRLSQLEAEPLCRFCAAKGRTTAATVADHVIPHRGDRALFFDPSNLQSLCTPCHDRDKQRLERSSSKGADLRGLPSDPSHPWFTGNP